MRNVYIHTPSMLPTGDHLSCHAWEEYLQGRIEDPFDSLQYLHLQTHRALPEHETPPKTWGAAGHAFVKSQQGSQLELAAATVRTAPPSECHHFIYCHQTFLEDLHICPAAWIQHVHNLRVEETCTVEYHGGINWGLALREAIDWAHAHKTPVTSCIVGAERVLAPVHRAYHPFGWISDAAAMVCVSSEAPTEGPTYLCEQVSSHYHPHPFAWAERPWDSVLDDTLTLLRDFFQRHPNLPSLAVYPAYAPSVLAQCARIHPGMAWRSGCWGMAYGVETIAVLASRDIPQHARCVCLFIEPGEAILGITLRRLR